MKTSTLIPVVAYLGLAGYTSAAPVNAEAAHALDKRTFCIFGFGWGCNTPTSTAAASKPTTSSAVSSAKAVVTPPAPVKPSSAVVATSSAKAVSSAAASSSVKAVVPTSSAVTKTSSASWAACTDFDWNAWGSDWTWGGGFDKDYVKAWYVDQYGFAPPAGMNWRQVSSLVSKFGEKTKPASPKTTSKYTGGKCANPWTSVANPKTKTAVTTSKAVSTSAAASKPVVTSVASSAVASKPVVSAPAASASASSSKAVVPASSSASAAAGGPAASASSAVVVQPAPSAASSAVVVQPAPSAASSAVVVQPAPSAASSAVVVQPAPSAASSSAADAASASPSPVASSASSAAASPAASSDAASAPAASPSAGSGSSDGSSGTGSGVPGTGAGVPGTGAGSNNATGTTTVEAPVATPSAPVSVNGFSYGGCAQEVTGRLLDKVQTSSSSQTIESCTALCSDYGYPVAGLEYGNECYCGTLEDIEDVAVSGECYMPCAGNANEICGGPNAINYYVDADIIPPTVELPAGWSTYGVVSEGSNGRILPVQIYSSNDNTVEGCANACNNAGYKIAGTEYSSECFCGNAFVSSANGGQLVDDSAAFMACSGNLAQKCGGPSILSVTSAFGNNIPFA